MTGSFHHQSARGNLALLRCIACRELRTLPLRFPAGVIFHALDDGLCGCPERNPV